MKSQFVIIVLSVFVFVACAQDAKPPENIKEAFEARFGEVKNVKWEQEDNNWEADFKNSEGKFSAVFDKDANWMETERDIKPDELPENIRQVLMEEYDDYEVDEVEEVEAPGFKGFEVELEKEEGREEMEITVLVTSEGEIVKEEEEDEEEDEDEEEEEEEDEDDADDKRE